MSQLRTLLQHRFRLPRLVDLAILLLALCLIWLAMAGLQPPNFRRLFVLYSFEEPMLLLLNALPIALILSGLYLATGRSLFSSLTTGAFFVTFGLINSIKSIERQEPFVPTDLRLFREALAIAGQYGMGSIFAMLGLVLFIILLGIFAFRFFSAAKLHLALRIVGPLAALTLLISLTFTVYADEVRYHSFTGQLGNRMADYTHRGFVYSFLHDITAMSLREPTRLDPSIFTALEAEALPPTEDGTRPNVVVIMAEAFSDMTNQPHFDFSGRPDPLEHFNRASADALLSGRLIVDVLGGGTAFTEFAFLTGISPVTLSSSISPYEFVRSNTDSIAWRFSDLGYDTIALHPFHGWFYNRINVFERLGFDKFLYGHAEHHFEGAPLRGSFVSEEATFDALIEILDDRNPADAPLFLFCITIQNHGPYLGKYTMDRQYFFDTDMDLSDEELLILDNFIYGLFDVDAQLARLIARLEADPEPYILLYFSDHQPSVRHTTMEALDWGSLWGPPMYVIQAYTVPFFIWQNEAARQEMSLNPRAAELELEIGMEFSAFYLSAVLLQLLDFGQYSPFFSHLNEFRTVLPIMRPSVYLAAGGELSRRLPAHLTELFDFYHAWSHYRLFHQIVQ